MAGINPNGNEKHWLEGEPYSGIFRPGEDTSTIKYAVSGEAVPELFPLVDFQNAGGFFLIFD